MHAGKCPKCDKQIGYTLVQQVNIKSGPLGTGTETLGASFQCPFCRAVLSVGIDPISLKTDIVNEILRELRKR
jgi:hypothetical protein